MIFTHTTEAECDAYVYVEFVKAALRSGNLYDPFRVDQCAAALVDKFRDRYGAALESERKLLLAKATDAGLLALLNGGKK